LLWSDLMQLAGKYLQKANQKIKPLLNDPGNATVAAGAAGAGLATLGNITSGEASQEGPGRLLLEAANAALVAGAAGSAIPSMRRLLSKRTIAENLRAEDMGKRGTGQGVELGAKFSTPEGTKMRESANRYAKAIPYAQGVAGAGLIAGAGGLGGLSGGGSANFYQSMGVPGFQNAIDPELPGSSNTINSRLNMQGYV